MGIRTANCFSILQILRAIAAGLVVSICAAKSLSAHAQEKGRQSDASLMDWRQTAALEHRDRMNRLRKLSDRRFIAEPQFYEELIPATKLPQYGVNIPVLRVVFQDQVFFDTAKWDVKADATKILDLVAESLKRDVPDIAVFVAGHTDSRGSDEYNYELSVRRADAVARALFNKGIGLARMWRVGFGEAIPVLPNTTSENMARNRRVEFLFGAKPEAVASWLTQQAESRCAEDSSQRICRIVAMPVNKQSSVSIAPLDERKKIDATAERAVGAASERPEIASGAEQRNQVEALGGKQTIAIEKNSPIILDIREQRYEVGRPIL